MQPELLHEPDAFDLHISRRQLLMLLAGAAAAAAGLACSEPDRDLLTVLPPGHSRVREFLNLSVLVTGVPRDRLDPEVAATLLAAFDDEEGDGISISRLAAAAGVSPVRRGREESLLRALESPHARRAANRIAEAWYRGQLPSDDGSGRSVTYTSALGWQALDFATAPTVCAGEFGHWAERPAA